MAKMIPGYVDAKTPPGERDVYQMLASGPDDWQAIHSLDLAPWNRGLRTEIDFVVIIPDTGVLCLEVKSHENIEFDGTNWSPPTICKSPFVQATDGRFALYRGLKKVLPDQIRFPIAHGCVFPRSPFDLPPNLSVRPHELMDSRAFRAFPDASSFCQNLRTRLQQSISEDRDLSPLANRLTNDQVETIIKCCLPIQRRRPSLREEITRREDAMNSLLQDRQKVVLEMAQYNDRLIVTGGAGTGKTLVAMGLARRIAENTVDQGQRVGLLCFNQLVGDWMTNEVHKTGTPPPNLVVGRALCVMAQMAGVEIPHSPQPSFWENVLPQKLEERITDPAFKFDAGFDYLVLDEAQDILARPVIWACLSQFLAGDLSKCKFALFGDFHNQVIAGSSDLQKTMADLKKTALPAVIPLRQNCRNYPVVGNTALSLSGLDKRTYSGYLRTGGSAENFDIDYYEDDQSQLQDLSRLLQEFKQHGYKPSEITLLSFCADEKSAACKLVASHHRLRPAWKTGEETAYCTIHAFKGMENKIIILTDAVLEGGDLQRQLFYTGMTRATESVRVLCHAQSKPTLLGWIEGD